MSRILAISALRRGLGKTTVIFPAAFMVSTGMGVLALGLVFYLRDVHHATKSQIGLLGATWAACYVIGCLLIRPRFDHVKPRYLILGSTFALSMLAAAIHLCGLLKLVFVFYSILGICCSFFWPPIMGWLSLGFEGTDLSKTMSRFNLSWSIGAIIGPFLAGWLSSIRPEAPIWCAASLFMGTSLMLAGAIMALPRMAEDDTNHAAGHDKADTQHATFLRYPAWVGNFTMFVVLGVIVCLFPDSSRLDLHLTKTIIGGLLFLRSLCATIAFLLLGKTEAWHYRFWPLPLAQVMMMLVMLGMMWTSRPFFLALLMIVIGLVMSTSYMSSLFHGVAGSSNRAGRMAIHEALIGAGLVCGSFIGGQVYQAYSMRSVYLFCAAVLLAGLLVQVTLYIRMNRPKGGI